MLSMHQWRAVEIDRIKNREAVSSELKLEKIRLLKKEKSQVCSGMAAKAIYKMFFEQHLNVASWLVI